jgi:hypothetical protein
MKVLISKYEIRCIEERWPDFEQCPDFVEVSTVPLSTFKMTPGQKKRLQSSIEKDIAKAQLGKTGAKSGAKVSQSKLG